MNKQKAQSFLSNALLPTPVTKERPVLKYEEKLAGGKSGAIVKSGEWKGQQVILKVYESRDLEKVFQDTSLDTEEKRVAEYRKQKAKKDRGDGVLSYIRSIRDVYLNILMNGIRVEGTKTTLTPTVWDYGLFQEDQQYFIYMVTQDISKAGFKELTNFHATHKYVEQKNRIRGLERLQGQSREPLLNRLRLLYRLIEALEVKFDSIQSDGIGIGCHRDLHPGNVFYKRLRNNDFQIKFIDFDLSITDSGLLTKNKSCTRKTMSDNILKRGLGKGLGDEWNNTLGKYVGDITRRVKLHRMFDESIAKNDADLYMFAAYLSDFLGGTEEIASIGNWMRTYTQRQQIAWGVMMVP